MGYNTDYTLKVHSKDTDVLNLVHQFLDEHQDHYYGLSIPRLAKQVLTGADGKVAAVSYPERNSSPPSDYGRGESVKWYDHDSDLKTMSMKFPDTLFELCGVGEDYPDIWRAFYKNGKMCKQRQLPATFPDFNESMLK